MDHNSISDRQKTPASSKPRRIDRMRYGLRLGLPLLIFGITLVAGVVLIEKTNNQWLRERQILLQTIGHNQANLLERRLNRSLSSAYVLGEQVRNHNGEIVNFERLADDLIGYLGGIASLQLAPDGVIEKIHPLAGLEQDLGHDILGDDSRRREALEAVANADITVADPLPLPQGGTGLVGRYPVFLADESGAVGRFWGFASTLINLEDLVKATGLPDLKQMGYRYRIRSAAGDAGTPGQQVAGDMNPEAVDSAFSIPLQVQNRTWYLDINYSEPATAIPGYRLMYSIAVAVAALAGFLVFFLIQTPDRLRREIARKTRQLEELSVFDPLTSLPNRKLFHDRLVHCIRVSERNNQRFALLFIDLDGFRFVNDNLGYKAGDKLLKEMARRLLGCIRTADTLSRMGGDEFTILMDNVSEDQEAISAVARRILQALEAPVKLSGIETSISGSIGITFFPDNSRDDMELLKQADIAMYRAKDAGRNNFRYFDNQGNRSLAR